MQCNGTNRYIKDVCYTILLLFLFIADIDEDQKCQVSLAYRIRNCHLSVLKVNIIVILCSLMINYRD